MSNQKNFRIHWFWAWVETHDSSGNVGFTQCIFLNFALWGGKGFSVMFHMKILKRRELSDLIPHCLVWSPVELSLFTPRTAGFHTCLVALHDFSPLVDLILHKRCKRKPINLCNSLSTSAHSQFLLWRIIKFETRSLGLGSALNFIDSAMSWVENNLAWSLSWSGPLSWAFSAILDHNVALVVLRPCPELLTSNVYLYMINKELHYKQKFVSKAISNQRYFWKANSHDDFIGCCSDSSIHFWFRSSFTCIKDWLNICHMPDTVLGEDT